MRANDPVHWCESSRYRPFWAVTRHADVMRVELDPTSFRNEPRQFLVTIEDEKMLQAQTGSSNFARNLVAMDDPDHRAYRALTAAWFGPKAVRSIEEEIPLRTIMIVLGVPREDEPLMLELSQKVFGSTDTETGGGDGMASMLEAFNAFNAYFSAITADRRVNPRNDVATILATAFGHFRRFAGPDPQPGTDGEAARRPVPDAQGDG